MNNAPKGLCDAVESPCIRNCCLNNEDICLGCYRHLNEITGWQGRNNSEKLIVLQNCEKRKAEILK
jgi:predicted Fe-S protein YdhL (DUF1289 family)